MESFLEEKADAYSEQRETWRFCVSELESLNW